MADPSPVVRPELLLAQHDWVRRVARALVSDANLAADLEQELWTDVLEHPPRVRGSIRGWLAAALRNNLLNRRRSDTRRSRREEGSSRPEAEESAADIVARADAHRRVVDAVLALEEPYRSTVLFRFFEDIEPVEIARRQGVPVETVRTRLKRALAALRERFSAGNGNDASPWALLLRSQGPAESPGPGMPVSLGGFAGGFVMASKSTAAVLGTAALLALGWFTLRPVAEVPIPPPAPVVAKVAPPARRPVVVAPMPVPEPPVAEEPPSPGPPPPPKSPEPEEMPLLVLSGTVRSTDGLPIEGARVSIDLESFRLRGRDGMPLPKDVVDRARPTTRSATTGADGAYSVEVRLPHDITFAVQVSAEGFLPVEGGVVAIKENLTHPRDFVLERAVGIEGRIVDQEGAPVPGASVFLWEMQDRSTPARTQTNYDGRFVLPEASAGAWTLDVQGGRLRNGVKWKERSHRRLVHGGDRNLEIVLEHSPLKGARVLIEVVDGSNGEPVEPAETSLNPTEGEPMEWTQRDSGIQASKGSLRIDIVEPGKWIAWARLQDGRVGWARFDVAPGDTEVRGRIEVGGTGSIAGKVDLRGLTLGPKDGLQVEVHFQETRAYPQFAFTDEGRSGSLSGHAWVSADGTFVVKGLLPGRFEVRAWARGVSALGFVEVRPNRRTTVDLAATKAGTLRFRLAKAMPPCRLKVDLFRPITAWSVITIDVERPFESEWTQDVEVHPGDYSWRARFENPADRRSLVQAARPASGTVTVESGETVEIVIPVVKEGN